MQLKGLVSVFTVIFIAISLYQLSFTQLVNNFESKQKAKVTQQIKANNSGLDINSVNAQNLINERLRVVLDSLGTTKIGMGKSYQKAKEEQLSLGLDLQGGMNVTLEVGLEDLIKGLAANGADPAINNAINKAAELRIKSQENFIDLFISQFKLQNPNAKLANYFTKTGNSEINYNSADEKVIEYIKREANGAVKNTYNVLLKRIDKFGVAQPTINLDENKDIITVELAGVQNPEKVRNLLQNTARLEFWETWSNYEVLDGFVKGNKALKGFLSGETKDSTGATTKADTIGAKSLKDLVGGNTDSKDTSLEARQKRNLIENPLVSLFAQVFNPEVNPKTQKYYENSRIALVFAKDTAKLNEYLALPLVKTAFPANCKFIYGITEPKLREQDKTLLYMYAIKTVPGSDKPRLTGETVNKTRADFDPTTGEPAVYMEMNQEGANVWRQMTGQNIGRQLAVVLDDIVYSAPNSQGEIPNGSTQISGSFTTEETNDLANILSSGKLDAPARIVQEQIVGPTLGKENIASGKMSFLIAFAVIFLLMLVYYNTSGVVANIALIFNLLFTIGVLSALHATLTMAGIAGLVLTIGMAVDTNVIIFERIKEELSSGKSHEDAVNIGYRRSLPPVLDGHFTVFLTAAMLFIFGLGPVKGFATTQMLGIVLSLFCGILLSRLITYLFMRKGKHLEYFTGISKSVFRKFHFKFIEMRKYAYVISIIVLILGVASFFNGFEKGVEFKGGRNYTVQLGKEVSTNNIREGLKKVFNNYPQVKTAGASNSYMIVTDYMKDYAGRDAEQKVQEKLYEGLKSIGAVSTDFQTFQAKGIISSNSVQPTISDDLQKGAIRATIISIAIIFLYILIRFRKWQYSLGTVIALLHDVLVMLAVFSFLHKVVPFSLEIDQHFIAALLTVIGFSMNDTVIVFDRIREYFAKRPGASKTSVINDAINDTLSRTIMTSLTVFLTILILFLFGGDATKGFAFAMLIGVITGTYSSIFVAAPVLVDLDKSETLSQEVDRDKKIEALKEMA
jgi:SecD/SecF fusion protein